MQGYRPGTRPTTTCFARLPLWPRPFAKWLFSLFLSPAPADPGREPWPLRPPTLTSRRTSARSAPCSPLGCCGCAAAPPRTWRGTALQARDLGESSLHLPPDRSGHAPPKPENRMTRRSSAAATNAPPPAPVFPAIPPADVLGRLAALQTMPTAELKQQWRELFGTEPPPFNRPYLQSRLAYRIQELAYGGLKPETRARLEALGEQLDGGNVVLRRIRADSRPLPGTRLLREMAGVQHVVTVLRRRLRVRGPALPVAVRHRARHHRHALERLDLLRAAPARWRMSRRNARRRRDAGEDEEAPLRGLHPQEHRRGARQGVQHPRRPARRLRGLRRHPARRGLDAGAATATTTAASRAARWSARR